MYEFIVPLIFVAIWVVTWILNRDTQPLPPRRGLHHNQNDERNDQPSWEEQTSETETALRHESSSVKPKVKPSTRSVRPEATLNPSDSIIFTEPFKNRASESFGSTKSQRPARGAQSRRAGRSKIAGAAKTKHRLAPERTRDLSQEVSNSLAQVKGRGLELKPLNQPLSPLTSIPLTQSGKSPGELQMRGADHPQISLRSEFSRSKLRDPARLREIFVWNELLLPPLALRNRHPRGH